MNLRAGCRELEQKLAAPSCRVFDQLAGVGFILPNVCCSKEEDIQTKPDGSQKAPAVLPWDMLISSVISRTAQLNEDTYKIGEINASVGN